MTRLSHVLLRLLACCLAVPFSAAAQTGAELAAEPVASAVFEPESEPGSKSDLVLALPLGLPPLPVPADNPLSTAKVALGRKLFFDRRLSLNNAISCALCHVPEQGFTNNELAVPVGFEGRTGRRNAPTLYNAAYLEHLFHDGRERALETQPIDPLLADHEMNNPSLGAILDKLETLPDYAGLFEAAFAGRGPTVDTLGMAFASYMRTLISANSPFDRWYYGGEENAVSDQAKRGFQLFAGKAGCAQCHLLNEQSALFTDQRFHNTGIGVPQNARQTPATRQLSAAPGVTITVDQRLIDALKAQRMPTDLGRYEVTQNPADRWAYRTPILRNIALTAPYMHDGSLRTLMAVIDYYDQGGVGHALQSALIRPLGLSAAEREALHAFLLTLTGDNVDLLAQDARRVEVGELRPDDPHWRHERAD